MTGEKSPSPRPPPATRPALPSVGTKDDWWPTYRVAVGHAEDRDHLAGVAHGEEGAVVGIRQVSHRALGLQELALVLQRGAQDGVQADVPVLQGAGQ